MCALATPAWAFDIENQDRKDASVVISRDDGSSETLTMKGGQELTDVCASCVILVGESSVEVRGRDTAMIRGSKVAIKSGR